LIVSFPAGSLPPCFSQLDTPKLRFLSITAKLCAAFFRRRAFFGHFSAFMWQKMPTRHRNAAPAQAIASPAQAVPSLATGRPKRPNGEAVRAERGRRQATSAPPLGHIGETVPAGRGIDLGQVFRQKCRAAKIFWQNSVGISPQIHNFAILSPKAGAAHSTPEKAPPETQTKPR